MILLINNKKKNLLSNSQNCKVRLTTVGFMDGRHFGEISMKTKNNQSIFACYQSRVCFFRSLVLFSFQKNCK